MSAEPEFKYVIQGDQAGMHVKDGDEWVPTHVEGLEDFWSVTCSACDWRDHGISGGLPAMSASLAAHHTEVHPKGTMP